jgi:hypothetical protein
VQGFSSFVYIYICHTAIENLSDPIGYLLDFTNPYYTNKQFNNFNRKITNDLELPQYRRQSDRRTWGSPS